VNTYPTVRGFTAIGTGGDDFVQAMVVAVESVIQKPIPQVCFIYQHLFFLGSISILFLKFGPHCTYLFGVGVVDLCTNCSLCNNIFLY